MTQDIKAKVSSDNIAGKVKLELSWHGIKRLPAKDGFRTIPRADLYIDCRGIAEKGIPGFTGKSPEFQAAIRKASAPTLRAFVGQIIDALPHIPSRRGGTDPFKEAFTVLFMCAHGVHRSVASCHIVAEALKAGGYNVTIVETKLPPEVVSTANAGRSLEESPQSVWSRLHRAGAKE